MIADEYLKEQKSLFPDLDNVNNPAHYGQGQIECINYIKDFLTDEEYTDES